MVREAGPRKSNRRSDATDPETAVLSSFVAPSRIEFARFISGASEILVATAGGDVIWLDPEGAVLNESRVRGHITAASATAEGSLVAVGTSRFRRQVHLLGSAGELLWSRRLGDWVSCVDISPKLDALVVGAGLWDGGIYFFESGGRLTLRSDAAQWPSAISYDPAGDFISVGSANERVCQLLPSGEMRWHSQLAHYVNSIGVATGAELTVVGTGPADGAAYAFNRAGELVWKARTREKVVVSTSGDGAISILGSLDKSLSMFSRAGKMVWSQVQKGPVTSVCISRDGSVAAWGLMGMHSSLLVRSGANPNVRVVSFSGPVTKVAVSDNGTRFLAVSGVGARNLTILGR